jgi:hypothetical protein
MAIFDKIPIFAADEKAMNWRDNEARYTFQRGL